MAQTAEARRHCTGHKGAPPFFAGLKALKGIAQRGTKAKALFGSGQVAGYGNKYLRQNGEQTRVTAEQVEESVNGSLSRLGTDYIDLLQVTLLLTKTLHRRIGTFRHHNSYVL